MSGDGFVLADAEAVRLALNTLRAAASDPREPERYREWYSDAAATLEAAVPFEKSGFGLVWEPGSSPLVKPWSRDYRPSRRIPVRVTSDNEHDIEWLWVKQ